MRSFRNAILLRLLLILTAGTVSVVGCGKSETTDSSKAEKTTGGPKITAEPNPILAGPDPGKTTISWDTGNGSLGQVYFKVNDTEEKRWFSGRATGSQEVTWIKKGARYEFKLYAGKDREKLLASVIVTKKAN